MSNKPLYQDARYNTVSTRISQAEKIALDAMRGDRSTCDVLYQAIRLLLENSSGGMPPTC